MQISCRERYQLIVTLPTNNAPATYDVVREGRRPRFAGYAAQVKPKLYVVSVDEVPVYVGVTKQPMTTRLRQGFKSSRVNGYDGYAWRNYKADVKLDVWAHVDAGVQDCLPIETVEAELVFLIRQAGQWPAHQTEIHFHPSTEMHRSLAAGIAAHYHLVPPVAAALG